MKTALSFRQPWAWLIVAGYKSIENRNWLTRFRGPLWIHAGLTVEREAIQWVRETFPDIPLPSRFETGGIVGAAVLVDCVRHEVSPWFWGPYGFKLADARAVPFVACGGRLGMFEVDARTLQRLGSIA